MEQRALKSDNRQNEKLYTFEIANPNSNNIGPHKQ